MNPLYLGTFVTALTMLMLPGLLQLLIFRIKEFNFWETVINSIGLSVLTLELGGLVMNQLLPQFGIREPLAYLPTLYSFAFLLCVLFIIAWVRTEKSYVIHIPNIELNKKKIVLFGVPLLFPVLAIFGAIRLNNGGDGIITLLLLGLIAAFVFLLAFLRKTMTTHLYPFTIYFTALALLFTTSIRSWVISGHDIMREYYVFMLTKQFYYWNTSIFKDAYNACLSITILPTLLNNMLFINDMYIYKVIFQCIFAFCPVLIYLLLRRYTNSFFAFLSSFYFMAFPTFYNDMPMLNRQEIGFLFFGLLLLMIFDTKLSPIIRKVFFVLFGVGVIVSHYSTNYVVLALLLGTFVLSKIMSLKQLQGILFVVAKKLRITPKNIITQEMYVPGLLIAALCVFTIFWNTQFTKTSNNITGVLGKTVSAIFIKSNNDAKSSDVAYSIFSSKKQDPEQLLNQYVESTIQQAKANGESNFYDRSIYMTYPTHLIGQQLLPLTSIGNILVQHHIPVLSIQSLLRSIAADAMQLLVLLGLVCFLYYKNRKPFDSIYLLFCVSGIVLLSLEIILPDLSVEYGLLRMFDQMLYFFSLAIVIATDALFFYVKQNRRIYLVTAFAVLFFLTLTGFISHITGDYYPTMTLDNSGTYYGAYYVHETDVASADWIKENKPAAVPIQADLKGGLVLQSYEDIFARYEIFPPIISKDAYVYIVTANQKDNAIVSIDKDILIFNGPHAFLQDHKDLLYNNGSNEIFK